MPAAGLPRSLRGVARLVLVLAAAAGAAWLATLDYGRKLSTNVVDLIPADEREPEVHLLRALASEDEARSVWAVLSGAEGGALAEPAVEAFVAALRADPAFDEVSRADDAGARDALGRFLHERSFTYLLPEYVRRHREAFAATGQRASEWPNWLAERVATDLEAFLGRPESAAFQDLIPADPLLLLPTLALEGRLLAPPPPEAGSPALVWARIDASPLEEAGQEPVFAALAAALQAGRAIDPELTLQWTGVNRFAAASQERIRAELAWLNLFSIVGVLTVSTLLLRSPWRIVHLLPVVLLALLGAWVAVTAAFDRLHVLVLVVGALLVGVAVDYGFHVYLNPARFPGEDPRARLRRVLRPLLTSCLTTVLGFSLLCLSDLPLLRQIGLFVSVGLLSALAAALLYFVQLNEPAPEIRWRRARSGGEAGHVRGRILLALAAATLAAGVWRLEWRDDIRDLEVPAAELQQNDQWVRARFGREEAGSVYLVPGRDIAEARERLEGFERWHERNFPGSSLASAGLMFPTRDAYTALAAELRRLKDFPDALSDAMERRGFVAEAFEPFFQTWRRRGSGPWPAYEGLLEQLQRRLPGPMSLLLNEAEGQAWLLARSDHPGTTAVPADLGVFEVNQLQSLNRLFERYRRNALHLSLAGFAVVALSVLLLYGFRRGLRIFLVPLGACLVAFGVLGWLDRPLNLFHLLGAFLGVCLSYDYAIFSAHRRKGEPPPPSIRLSALTTAASFGVLASSRIPAVSALGSTVFLIVLAALVAVEVDRAGGSP